jgi:predicted transcriptional regulator
MQKELQLETRREIYEYIMRHPGTYLRELARALGMAIGLVEYHLNYLAKHGILVSSQEGREKRFYPRNLDVRHAKLIDILAHRTRASIVLLALEQPGISHKDLSLALERAPSTVSFHLRKLLRREVLLAKRRGAERGYYVKDPQTVLHVLLAYKPCGESLVDKFYKVWDF